MKFALEEASPTYAEANRIWRESSPAVEALDASAGNGAGTELFTLEWNQINHDRRELILHVTKTDTPRAAPLTVFGDMAYNCLKKHPRHISSRFVFCKKETGEPHQCKTRGLNAAVIKAGIKHCTWHDLRRTCGSWLLQSGMDIFRVSRWLGHKSVATTERSYAFLNSQSLHEAAQNLPQGTWIAKVGKEKPSQAIDLQG